MSVLAAATAFGLWRRARDGRPRRPPAHQGDPLADPALLASLGVDTAASVTLLQFSSAFCAPCRATRRICADVAQLLDGVRHVEVDAERHLDAVRALGIWRTPTVLVLDSTGRIVRRAVGAPTKAAVVAAVAPLLPAAARPCARSAEAGDPLLLDPRGPRFAAALTTVIWRVLVAGSLAPVIAGALVLAQAVVFAITAADPRRGPYGLLYRAVLARRLGPPAELEPAAPVRFAQLVGLVFALVAAGGFLGGVPVLGFAAAGAALAAAFLNAVFALCLGCEVYLAFRRLTKRPVPARVPAS